MEVLNPVEVPFEKLSESAQDGVIDEFIQREGTDYGFVEASQERKVADIRRQIERGDVKLIYDPATESITLLTDREWKTRLREQKN